MSEVVKLAKTGPFSIATLSVDVSDDASTVNLVACSGFERPVTFRLSAKEARALATGLQKAARALGRKRKPDASENRSSDGE